MSPQTCPGDQGTPIITNLAAPYALIRSGRPRPGRRPGTALAYLTQAITAGGQVRAYRAVSLGPDGQPRVEIARRVEPKDVIQTFCRRPTRHAVDRARASLPPVGGRGDWV
jgi:hypothetical protein